MVIKANILHSGWSYGNGNNQYDNESIGSTRKVFTLKKPMENSSRNKKNEKVGIMCSRNKDEYTDEHGWTTIDNNSSRKPKKINSKRTQIKSIISTIDIDPLTDNKGAPEARIDSPMRENSSSLPEEITKQEEFKTKEQRKYTVTLSKGKETGIESTAQNTTILETAGNKRYEKKMKVLATAQEAPKDKQMEE
jgi:hypothetical protein